MNSKKFTLGGAAWSSFADASMPISGLATTIFLSRFLGPTDYGYWFLLAAIIIFSERLITVFLSPPTVKIVAIKDTDFSGTILTLYIASGVLMGVIILCSAPLLAHFFHSPRMSKHLVFFAIELPIFALSSGHIAILTGRGFFEARAILVAIRWTLRMVFILIFVFAGFGINGAIGGSISALVIQLLIGRFFIRPLVQIHAQFPWKKFSRLAAPFFFFTILLDILVKLDVVLLKHFGYSEAVIGGYAAAQNLAYAPTFFTASISLLLIATLSKLENDGRIKKSTQVTETTFRFIPWLLPMCAAIAGSHSEIILLIFGDQYIAAADIINILVFASVPLLIIQTSSGIFMAKSRPILAALQLAPTPIIYIVIAVIGRVHFSELTAAALMVLSLSGVAVVNMIFIHSKWRIRFFYKSWLINCCIAFIIYFGGRTVHAHGLLLIAELLFSGVIIFVLLTASGEIPRALLLRIIKWRKICPEQ